MENTGVDVRNKASRLSYFCKRSSSHNCFVVAVTVNLLYANIQQSWFAQIFPVIPLAIVIFLTTAAMGCHSIIFYLLHISAVEFSSIQLMFFIYSINFVGYTYVYAELGCSRRRTTLLWTSGCRISKALCINCTSYWRTLQAYDS